MATLVEGILTSYVDAAIAELKLKDSILDLEGLKKPVEIYELVPSDQDTLEVHMRGRVSTSKSGIVKHVYSNPFILYDNPKSPVRKMRRLIQVENLSKKGDSGGPVFTDDGKVIGIIVAGSNKYSYVIPIKSIMNRLDVRV